MSNLLASNLLTKKVSRLLASNLLIDTWTGLLYKIDLRVDARRILIIIALHGTPCILRHCELHGQEEDIQDYSQSLAQ